MLYPFMTLNDGTEIVHSEIFIENGEKKVKVVIEKPIYGGFQHAECYLPEYRWDAVEGFSKEETEYYEEYIRTLAHVIISLAAEGGFEEL